MPLSIALNINYVYSLQWFVFIFIQLLNIFHNKNEIIIFVFFSMNYPEQERKHTFYANVNAIWRLQILHGNAIKVKLLFDSFGTFLCFFWFYYFVENVMLIAIHQAAHRDAICFKSNFAYRFAGKMSYLILIKMLFELNCQNMGVIRSRPKFTSANVTNCQFSIPLKQKKTHTEKETASR